MIRRGSRLRVAVDGFTLLELAVVICLVGIFAAVALDRFLRYQEIAEKAAMEATIGALRSAQAMQASARILRQGLKSVASLADENPIDWLAAHPAGYRGALYDSREADATGGSWYFDLRNKELAYVPERTRFFTPGADGRRVIRFRAIATIEKDERAGTLVLSELDVRRVSQGIWAPEF